MAGIQAKLLLTALPDGRFARPNAGHASTHLLKPEPPDPRLAGLAANEAWCQELAAAAEVPAAEAHLTNCDGRPVVVVTRYDRESLPTGVRRLHQEDLSQAAASPDNRKYAYEGGPVLADAARLLRAYAASPIHELNVLGEQLVFKAAIGDTDWHARNLSFLIRDGAASVAPVYDSLCTVGVTDWEGFGMTRYVIAEVSRVTLTSEIESWGVPARIAARLIDRTLDALQEAIGKTNPAAAAERVVMTVRRRLANLVNGKPAGAA